MESALTHAATRWPRSVRQVERATVSTWALVAGLVLYLAFSGGGYDFIVSSQVGLILWWAVLIGAACGILPVARPSRAGWLGLGLFSAFVAWTALGITWSISAGRSAQDLGLIATYLAVLTLGVTIHRDRERAIRHTVHAAAASIAFVCLLAVIARLIPGSFPASHTTGSFLGGARGRLSWPVNYWNGLAALCALGMPLLAAEATSAARVWQQSLAAAAIPVVGLCEYLTFSRGGAISGAVALAVFIALAPDRIPKLATALLSGAGTAILIAGAHHRRAVDQGLTGHLASSQGRALLVALVVVCAAVALAQAGIGLARRHAELPRILRVPVPRARMLLVGVVALAVVVAIAAGAPHRLSTAWDHFKSNGAAGTTSNLAGRFGSVSGEGRYSYWKVGIDQTSNRRLDGSGPGTFQLLWLPHATFWSPVVNAHSLYVETLVELGIVGLALLVALFVFLLVRAVRVVIASAEEARTRAAGVAAALVAFMVAASVDWVWQLPVLVAIFMLLAAALLAPQPQRVTVRAQLARDASGVPASGSASAPARAAASSPAGAGFPIRLGFGVVAAACLIAIAIPYASSSDVRASQNAVNAGDTTAALADARSAVRVDSGDAASELQLALVLELRHQYPAALAAASAAIRDEPQNWSEWLIRSRLDAESGLVSASIADYDRARSLNPFSPLFTP